MPDSSFQHCDAFDLLKDLDTVIGTVDVKSLLVFYLFDLESTTLSHYGVLLQRVREGERQTERERETGWGGVEEIQRQKAGAQRQRSSSD